MGLAGYFLKESSFVYYLSFNFFLVPPRAVCILLWLRRFYDRSLFWLSFQLLSSFWDYILDVDEFEDGSIAFLLGVSGLAF